MAKMKYYNGSSWDLLDSDTVDGKHANNTANNIPVIDAGGFLPVSIMPAFTATTNGIVPTPGATSTVKYLRADGTWQIPPDTNTTYSTFTTTVNGLVPNPGTTSTTKYLRADGTWAIPPLGTVYTAFTTTQEGLVPAPTATNTAKYLRGDGTWQTPPDTQYSIFTSSTSGLVPPGGANATSFLRADGTWQSITIECRTSDPVTPTNGQMWIRTDL